METKKVTIEKPVLVAGVVIVPIIEQYAGCYFGRGGFYWFGARQPIAIILASSSGKKAFKIDEDIIKEITLEQLVKEIPETAKTLESL